MACAGGGGGESQSALLAPPPDDAGVQLRVHAVEAAREGDVRVCQLVALPAGGMDVAALEHRLSEGAVELTVRHTSLEVGTAALGRVGCDAVDDAVGTVAYASTDPEGIAELPEGTALRFAPAEVVLLEARFAPGDAPASVALNLWVAEEPPALRTDSIAVDLGPGGAGAHR